jgi:hypothetical protein
MSALLVQLARLDPPAPVVHRAALDLQALLDPQEQPARKVTRERKGRPAPSVRPAKPARKASLGPKVPKAPRG